MSGKMDDKGMVFMFTRYSLNNGEGVFRVYNL